MIETVQSVAVEQATPRVEGISRTAQRDQFLTMLFNLAFAGDQLAWAELLRELESLTRAWVGRQAHVEPIDVLQEAWLAFARYAPQQFRVVDDTQLGSVLAYLRTCVKTALIQALRKECRHTALNEAFPVDESPSALVDGGVEEAGPQFEVMARLACLVKTPEEQYIWHRYFVAGWTPRMIVAHGDPRFASIQLVNQIIQRLMRRFRNDRVLQALYAPADQSCLLQA